MITIKRICQRLANRSKQRSVAKGLEYNIDSEYLESIYPKDHVCPILGYKMKPNSTGISGQAQTKMSPTLDRINPRKGYIKGNVEFVCGLANSMMTYAEGPDLIRFAKWINKKYNK